MIRIGVVGCGYFGAEFARAVMELPEAELAVVYSPGENSVRLSREQKRWWRPVRRILTIHIERTGWEEKKAIVSWKKVQEKSGGHLFHHIHEIDILQWIMGLPTEIYAVGGNLGHDAVWLRFPHRESYNSCQWRKSRGCY